MVHALRWIILGALGLGALYTLHLLAMDFNRWVRRPVMQAARALTGLSKRDLRAIQEISDFHTEEHLKDNWTDIINSDPLGCVPSLICQIISGAERSNKEAALFAEFVRYSVSPGNNSSDSVPKKVLEAYNYGLKFKRRPSKCYPKYPFCIYSAKTMFGVLSWYLKVLN